MTTDRLSLLARRSLVIDVPGMPVQQGSMRAVPVGGGRHRVIADNEKRLKPWRAAIAESAQSLLGAEGQFTGAVAVLLMFRFTRPQGHYGQRGLRPSAPPHKTTEPDVDKLSRAVLDALTESGLWRSDAQVVDLHAIKVFSDKPGAQIRIEEVLP